MVVVVVLVVVVVVGGGGGGGGVVLFPISSKNRRAKQKMYRNVGRAARALFLTRHYFVSIVFHI